MADINQRVTHLETWAKGHDERCGDRHGVLMDQLDDLRDDAKKSRHMLIACLIALLAWGAKELWTTRALAAASAVVSVIAAAKPSPH